MIKRMARPKSCPDTNPVSPPSWRLSNLADRWQHGGGFGERTRIGAGRRIRANHLSRLRRGEAELASHLVDARRIAQLRFAEAELAILLFQLLHLFVLALDPVAVLDRAEVLPAIHHDEAEEDRHRRGEETHLLDANRV